MEARAEYAGGAVTTAPRFAIGIDLGTTNSALAYVDTLRSEPVPEVLQVLQPATADTTVSLPILPSLLYYLTEGELKFFDGAASSRDFIRKGRFAAGRYAQEQLSGNPGRVIHSAKSWFVHERIDKHDAILPWESDEVSPSEKVSPLRASAEYLSALKDAWDHEVAAGNSDYEFAKQEVIITVPASFDEGAQQLTLEAAALAGYPGQVRLVEEPQAALYSYLRDNDDALEVLSSLPSASPRILVCDIGGGTTDLSLFVFEAEAENPVRRLDVSDHILLGGDNIDLAIALLIENKSGVKFSALQRRHLLFQARWLKERVLAEDAGNDDAEITVPIPGAGGSLFAAALSVRIRPSEIVSSLIEGFFPDVSGDSRPFQKETGLQEFGLPYAADNAITRHIAGFLRGRKVDAVLYNGGTLEAPVFRAWLNEQFNRWQGREIFELKSSNKALAVARGAAEYAYRLRTGRGKIRAAYPRSVYLELATAAEKRQAVCIVRKGLEAGQRTEISEPGFEVITGEPVKFQAFTSATRTDVKSGEIIDVDTGELHELPPLETFLSVQPGFPRGALRVTLEGSVNELGMLELFCVHQARSGQKAKWELHFNLRMSTRGQSKRTESAPVARDAGLVTAASEKILSYYGKSKSGIETNPPGKLLRELEGILKKPREQWDLPVLRGLWTSLVPGITRRNRSLIHETTWFYLAGYALRPGSGFPLDSVRVNELWRAYSLGRYFKKDANSRVQWWIMWRRVAAGLDQLQQEALFHEEKPQLSLKGGEHAELIRMLGSLERLNLDLKRSLGESFLGALSNDHCVWALGRLGSRELLCGPHLLVPVGMIEEWIEAMLAGAEKSQALFNSLIEMGRISAEQKQNIDESLRAKIRDYLVKQGVGAARLQPLEEYVPIDQAGLNQLFGEDLPLGLRLMEEGE